MPCQSTWKSQTGCLHKDRIPLMDLQLWRHDIPQNPNCLDWSHYGYSCCESHCTCYKLQSYDDPRMQTYCPLSSCKSYHPRRSNCQYPIVPPYARHKRHKPSDRNYNDAPNYGSNFRWHSYHRKDRRRLVRPPNLRTRGYADQNCNS